MRVFIRLTNIMKYTIKPISKSKTRWHLLNYIFTIDCFFLCWIFYWLQLNGINFLKNIILFWHTFVNNIVLSCKGSNSWRSSRKNDLKKLKSTVFNITLIFQYFIKMITIICESFWIILINLNYLVNRRQSIINFDKYGRPKEGREEVHAQENSIIRSRMWRTIIIKSNKIIFVHRIKQFVI